MSYKSTFLILFLILIAFPSWYLKLFANNADMFFPHNTNTSTNVLFHYNNQYNDNNEYDCFMHEYYVIECVDFGEQMRSVSALCPC